MVGLENWCCILKHVQTIQKPMKTCDCGFFGQARWLQPWRDRHGFHLQQPLGGPWFLNDVDKTLYNYLLKWSWIILNHQDPNAASSSWLQYSKLRCLPICCSVWLGLFPSLYGLMIYALFCCFVSRVSSSGIQECKTCKFLLYVLYEANMVGPILTHPCFLGY